MASVTITTSPAEDARLAPAFGDLLKLSGNATSAQVKAWLVLQMQFVVTAYETRLAEAAIVTPAPITPA